MAYSKNYSQEEIRIFRKKDLRSLIQTLINADGMRNQGTSNKMNREEIKRDLEWVLSIEEDMVDKQNEIESKKLEEKTEKEITEKEPF